MNMKKIGSLGAVFAMAAMAPGARASTVDTFSFFQSGWGGDGVLAGSFTGTVGADGYIEQSDLSAFYAMFSVPVAGGFDRYYFYLNELDLFSFLPAANGTNSSLDIDAVTPGFDLDLCVGAAAAFGLCGEQGNAVGVATAGAVTNELPSVTLQSSVTTSPVSAPEPGTSFLCGITLLAAGLGYRGLRYHRHASRPSPPTIFFRSRA